MLSDMELLLLQESSLRRVVTRGAEMAMRPMQSGVGHPGDKALH